MRILGIHGGRTSGKNTLSNFLHGYQLKANDIITGFSIDVDGKLHVDFPTEKGVQSGMLDVTMQGPEFALWASQSVWPYVKNYAFADALKEIAINLFGVPEKLAYGSNKDKETRMEHLRWEWMPGIYTNEKMYRLSIEANPDLEFFLKYHKPGPMTIREFLQYFGTEICRKIYDSIWVNALIGQIKSEESALAIISDVRFNNEAEAILEAGGKVIELTRREILDNHTSEKGISPHLVSSTLDNANLDLVDTCTQLLQIIDSFGWTE